MSVWYSLCGEVPVKNDPEVRRIVDRFNGMTHGQIQADIIETDDPNKVVVEFSGGAVLSRTSPEEIDKAALRLAQFVTSPSFLEWEYDAGRGKLYIGPTDKEATAQSEDCLKTIMGLVQHLTTEDKAKLREAL